MTGTKRGALLETLFFLAFGAGVAQSEPAEKEEPQAEHGSSESHAKHGGGIHHRHHLGLFIGGSHSGEEDGFTLGGEYEFRFNRYLGAGAFGEVIGGDFGEVVFGGLLNIHPGERFTVFTGPGWDRRFQTQGDESPEAHQSSEEPAEEGRQFLWRAGLMYEIPAGRIRISPNLAVDFLEGHRVFIYGVTLGSGF